MRRKGSFWRREARTACVPLVGSISTSATRTLSWNHNGYNSTQAFTSRISTVNVQRSRFSSTHVSWDKEVAEDRKEKEAQEPEADEPWWKEVERQEEEERDKGAPTDEEAKSFLDVFGSFDVSSCWATYYHEGPHRDPNLVPIGLCISLFDQHKEYAIFTSTDSFLLSSSPVDNTQMNITLAELIHLHWESQIEEGKRQPEEWMNRFMNSMQFFIYGWKTLYWAARRIEATALSPHRVRLF